MSRAPIAGGASAPGKMMISGEYAVLAGAPAIVAAVQTRAYARFVAEAPTGQLASASRFPEAHAARGRAEQELGPVPGELAIDVSELRREGQKLGVGSSSAAAAAAAGAVLAVRGHDLSSDEVQRRALGFALDGHRTVAPKGSGADVAACTLGGFVRYRRTPGHWEVEADRLAWPKELVWRVAWTGQAASTRALIEKVDALRERAPRTYDEAMGRLADESERFVEAFGDAGALLDATRRYCGAMDALGQAAGAPIVEQRLRTVAALAQRAGGAAKPSGAGGGDVALALFGSREDAARFDEACREAGIALLDVELGGPGVRPL